MLEIWWTERFLDEKLYWSPIKWKHAYDVDEYDIIEVLQCNCSRIGNRPYECSFDYKYGTVKLERNEDIVSLI